MSMNLCFNVVGSKEWIDFPFQTPTTLTFKVMEATTIQEQMAIVKSYIYDQQGLGSDQEYRDRIWRRCWGLMNSAHLQLSMI